MDPAPRLLPGIEVYGKTLPKIGVAGHGKNSGISRHAFVCKNDFDYGL
jgi:hypothetical protein